MFPGQMNRVWTYNEIASAYYYHRFYEFEPELKIAEPEVQNEIHRIIEFWLSFEISGLRIDAASHMIEQKGLAETKPENPHGILKEFRRIVEKRDPNAVLLGEADVNADKLAAFFGDDDQFHMLFNFLQAQYSVLSFATERKEAIVRLMNLLPSIPATAHWVNFLRNLDELDMERLGEEERQCVFDAFAPEEEMQLFGRGLRRRLAPMLGGDQRRIQLAYSLLFSLPGSPMIVYGDEIGMGENLSLQGRNAVRTPMQWSEEANAGFSSAKPDQLVRPVITNRAFSYKRVNVAEQEERPDSLLNWMRELIRVRRQCPEIGWGTLRAIETETPHVLVHRCEWQGDSMVAVHNLSGEEHEVTLELSDYNVRILTPLIGNVTTDKTGGQIYHLEIPAYGHQWYRIDHEPEL
jgi:maltose alpha-D-glucosyltransferase/alpha-amylase